MQELWFLRSARCLMLIDTYMKFREASLMVFKLKIGLDFVTDRQNDFVTKFQGKQLKKYKARVMVLALCTSS